MASGYIDLPIDGVGGTVDLTTEVTGILPILNGGTGSATKNFVDLTTAQTVAGEKSFTSPITVTSAGADSFDVGPTGSTNPVFVVDSSTASVANGLKVTGTTAAAGVNIDSISTNANEGINISTKGSGGMNLKIGASTRVALSSNQISLSVSASATASTNRFLFTGAADTTLTASTEATSAYWSLNQTRQHATGALALQRDFRISPSTHSFVGASTITNASTFSIDGAPVGGTNATLTTSSALYIPTSTLANTTNGLGLYVFAPTSATNNGAAGFNGGVTLTRSSSSITPGTGFLNFTSTGTTNFDPANGGVFLKSTSLSIADNTTAAAGTATSALGFAFTGNVLSSTNSITTTDVAMVSVGQFRPGTNQTITNLSAINIPGGSISASGGTALNTYGIKVAASTGGTNNYTAVFTGGNVGIGTTSPGTPLHITQTLATAYTSSSAAIAIPAGVAHTIENLDTTNATQAFLGFVSKSGGNINRTYIGNVSEAGFSGNFVIGQRSGGTAYNERFRITNTGSIGINTASPAVSAILDVASTTQGFLPPRVTTAQKTAISTPTAGLVVYDTTLNKLAVYTTAWETVTSV